MTFVNEHPTYMQSIRGDTDFVILLEYFDGRIGELSAYSREHNVIVRMLDTRMDNDIHDNLGFVLGVNEKYGLILII